MYVDDPYTLPLLEAVQYGMQNRCIGAYDEWYAQNGIVRVMSPLPVLVTFMKTLLRWV